MKKINDGGPAFPTDRRQKENYMDERGYGRTRTVTVSHGGMSLRAYFAGQAVQGLLAMDQVHSYVKTNGKPCQTLGEVQARIAEIAVGYADALIAELAKEPTHE